MNVKVLIAGLVAAGGLLAQPPEGPHGWGAREFGGPGGAGRGGMMDRMQTVTGAPYSAVEVRTHQQVLAAGNTIQRQEQTNVRRGGTFTPFAVAAIPGAFGFDSSESGFAGHNVEFVVGRDVVLVGVGYPLAASPAPTRQLVTKAAMTIYGRLVNHG